MSDTPKFEVIDRRKYKAEEEEREASASSQSESASEATVKPAPEPEPKKEEPRPGPQLVTETSRANAADEFETGLEAEPELPPAPTAEESRQQKTAYDASSQRLEDIIRAQNPGVGPQPPSRSSTW